MKAITVLSVGSLVCCLACVEEERAPARRAPTTTVVVTHPAQQGVTNVQPAGPTPAGYMNRLGTTRNAVVTASPATELNSPAGIANMQARANVNNTTVEPAAPSLDGALPYLATEPLHPPVDPLGRTSQILRLASNQIERLRRMASVNADTHGQDIESTLRDLEGKRDRLIQDLRESELLCAGRAADGQASLDTDIDILKEAVQMSYALAPPPAQGLPLPSPLPPSMIH